MTRSEVWTPEENARLLRLHSIYADSHKKWDLIAGEMGKTREAVRMHWRTHPIATNNRLQTSPYPKYDQPLVMEAESATVIPDLELPFHKAEFVNRVLDLSQAWKVDHLILAGDMLHFNSLSSWEPNWQKPNGKGGLDEIQEARWVEFGLGLRGRQKEKFFDLMDDTGVKMEDGDPNVSEELRIARKSTDAINQCFSKVDLILGNHEGRLLRALNSPLFATEITDKVKQENWRIAPYYYSELISGGEKFRIEHPKSAAKITPERLASKFLCHILAGHSHLLSMNWDLSGNFYCIYMGHCCDERRMPYAAQRSTNSPTHLNGAVIVRDGIPWLLHDKVDWKRLAKL
jgi:hypothetical protein